MQHIYLSIPGNVFLHIQSSIQLEFEELLAQAYVPGLNVLKDKERASQDEIIIEYVSSGEKGLFVSDERIVVKDDWGQRFPLDFYHLLYSIARLQFLKQGLYPVHAACVNDILLVGHSGVGKTAVTLGLALEHNVKIFSGNKTVVLLDEDSMRPVAGTQTFTAEMKYKERYANMYETFVEYHNRFAFTLKERGFSNAIRAVAIMRLNDGVEERELLSPLSALHKLHPYFLDAVNADTIMCDGRAVHVGNIPEKAHERLAFRLNSVLSHVPVYSVSGSFNFVSNSILQI